MPDGHAFAGQLGPVPATSQGKAAAARQVVLARTARPGGDPARPELGDTMDVLAMLGLVEDPRVHPDTGQWLPAHRPGRADG